MHKSLKSSLRSSFLRRYYDAYLMRQWVNAGKPVPPPYAFKRRTIVECARAFECRTLVETGTLRGDTMYLLRNDFDLLYSIEIDNALFLGAVDRLERFPQITLVKGDSSTQLPLIASQIATPALFWLDGHYSGPGTGRGNVDSPVIQELSAVFEHPIKQHVILIDDARYFNGTAGYPALSDLERWVSEQHPSRRFSVEHDLIQILPEHPSGERLRI